MKERTPTIDTDKLVEELNNIRELLEANRGLITFEVYEASILTLKAVDIAVKNSIKEDV